MMADEIDEGMDALRELEVHWLAAELSRAVANLPYPVGMGVPLKDEHARNAANKIFDRFAKMIEMTRRARRH